MRTISFYDDCYSKNFWFNEFDLIGFIDIVEFSTRNDFLKIKVGSYDRKWLEESRATLLKQFDDEKRANLIIPRMEKQKEK